MAQIKLPERCIRCNKPLPAVGAYVPLQGGHERSWEALPWPWDEPCPWCGEKLVGDKPLED